MWPEMTERAGFSISFNIKEFNPPPCGLLATKSSDTALISREGLMDLVGRTNIHFPKYEIDNKPVEAPEPTNAAFPPRNQRTLEWREPAVNQNTYGVKQKHHARVWLWEAAHRLPLLFTFSVSQRKKALTKLSTHSLTVETLQRAVKRGNLPDILKAINDKPTANVILGEALKAFPPRSGAGQGWPLPPCLFQFPPVTCFGGFM